MDISAQIPKYITISVNIYGESVSESINAIFLNLSHLLLLTWLIYKKCLKIFVFIRDMPYIFLYTIE